MTTDDRYLELFVRRQPGTADLLWQHSDGSLRLDEMINNQLSQSTVFGGVGPEWQLL
jgi:hypothetical protein